MAARIGAANVQGVRKGGLANCRQEDSPIYSLFRLRSTLLHHLQSQLGVRGQVLPPPMDKLLTYGMFCFHPAASATEVRLALEVAALSRSLLLFAWIWWLIVYLALHAHSAVVAQHHRYCCLPYAWTWCGCSSGVLHSSCPTAITSAYGLDRGCSLFVDLLLCI